MGANEREWGSNPLAANRTHPCLPEDTAETHDSVFLGCALITTGLVRLLERKITTKKTQRHKERKNKHKDKMKDLERPGWIG